VGEIKATERANKLLFLDTEVIVTQFYSNLYNNAHQKVLDEIARLQNYDLWIFLEPDVKWVHDGLRVHGTESERLKNNNHLKTLLDNHNISYKVIKGNYEQRLNGAMELIDELMEN